MTGAVTRYLWGMKQIDQDPGGYRVQTENGEWIQRVNKPLCRWLGVAAVCFAGYLAFASGGSVPLAIAGMSFVAGGLITLSLKSLNW